MAEHTPGPVWSAKIGYAHDLPAGADLPMRNAVGNAFRDLTDEWPDFIFSGWGGELTEGELAMVEGREPDPSHYANERIRNAAPDLLAACEDVHQRLYENGLCPCEPDGQIVTVCAIAAVIAKARGEL